MAYRHYGFAGDSLVRKRTMTKAPAPSDLADKFVLRLPEGMRERVANAAKINNRSMNAEIVSRLESSLDPANNKPAGLDIVARAFQEASKDKKVELEKGWKRIDQVLMRLSQLEKKLL